MLGPGIIKTIKKADFEFLRLCLLGFVLVLFYAIPGKAQIRNRLGFHSGYVAFPAWTSGSLTDGLVPPHGEFGIFGGLSYLLPVDKNSDFIVSGGLAFHRLHFHSDRTLRFNYPFAYLNTVYNRHFKFKYKGNSEIGKYFFGMGLSRANIFGSRDYSAGGGYQTSVFTKLPLEPELMAGLGLVFKKGSTLFHFNLAYRYSPLKNHHFRVALEGMPDFAPAFRYENLTPELVVFPDFRNIKRKKGRAKVPIVPWNFY
jgi:hypothetical protein